MKGKTGITLRINKNYFQDEQLLHLLFLVRRQKTLKKRNVFANNISNDIKLSIVQLPKETRKLTFRCFVRKVSWSIDKSCCSFG